MKINIEQISSEGVLLTEDISPGELDLDTEVTKFISPIKVSAKAYKITNAVSISFNLKSTVHFICSRCLEEFDNDFSKSFELNFPVSKSQHLIDLNQDIREEIVLDYPIKPLCFAHCKGLCPECGSNLNLGKCKCN